MNAPTELYGYPSARAFTRLPDFRAAKVLVVGDIMLDQYWHGAASRISPEAPVPVVAVHQSELRLGGAANVAANLAALGVQVALAGFCGSDDHSETLRRLLDDCGVADRIVRIQGARTITKLRVMAQNQQLIRLDFEDSFDAAHAARLDMIVDELLARVDALILSDYAKGALSAPQRWISCARARGIPVVVDPKGLDFSRYAGATVITPNLGEFAAVAGISRDEAELASRAARLRADLELDSILVTRSERGMSLFGRDRDPLHLPARAVEVYDVTGAGDTVAATLAACLAAGSDIEAAAELANLAAGLVVAKLGTSTITAVELLKALTTEDLQGGRRGVCSRDELLMRVRWARDRGERVVMTNGCFDLLHPGHVDYLERARALGDRLIVAVNDDESVRSLKGSSRPIQPIETRLRMLSALGCVDWVVAFSGTTPEPLYADVLPDVLVKGADYEGRWIAGADLVQAAGGTVRLLPLMAGYSTTRLVERIRAAGAPHSA